jgi:hypothetical protein
MCPICTVTVVAGLGISRLLGIDDVVSAIWIGALIMSLSFITIDWIHKKWPKFNPKYYSYPTFIVMYLFVLIPLKLDGIIGIIGNTIIGMDKVVFGILVGSVTILAGALLDKLQRKKYPKIFFPFQKVVFPVALLILISIVFYLITK